MAAGEHDAMMKEMRRQNSTGASPHTHQMAPATLLADVGAAGRDGRKVYVACNKATRFWKSIERRGR